MKHERDCNSLSSFWSQTMILHQCELHLIWNDYTGELAKQVYVPGTLMNLIKPSFSLNPPGQRGQWIRSGGSQLSQLLLGKLNVIRWLLYYLMHFVELKWLWGAYLAPCYVIILFCTTWQVGKWNMIIYSSRKYVKMMFIFLAFLLSLIVKYFTHIKLLLLLHYICYYNPDCLWSKFLNFLI